MIAFRPAALQDSAIVLMVIDGYEVSSEPAELLPSEIAAMPPRPLDGTVWCGGSCDVQHITSLLHPTESPHGRLVFSLVESLFRNQGAELVAYTSGIDRFGTEAFDEEDILEVNGVQMTWMRDVEEWQLNGATFILVAVDTDAYETGAIRNRIETAIELFKGEGVTKFVLNMSFALLPTEAIPVTTFGDFIEAVDDLGLSDQCEELAGEDCGQLAQQADPPTLDADSQQTLMSVLTRPEFFPVRRQVYAEHVIPDLQAAFETFYDDESPDFLDGDPLAELFTEGGFEETCGAGVECIAVAAAGDAGLDFPVAPASFSGVISVGATYSGGDVCLAFLGSEDSISLASNGGADVQSDGMYNCLTGTSFAAARVSFEQALELAAGN
jgi:hypothetical protein